MVYLRYDRLVTKVEKKREAYGLVGNMQGVVDKLFSPLHVFGNATLSNALCNGRLAGARQLLVARLYVLVQDRTRWVGEEGLDLVVLLLEVQAGAVKGSTGARRARKAVNLK